MPRNSRLLLTISSVASSSRRRARCQELPASTARAAPARDTDSCRRFRIVGLEGGRGRGAYDASCFAVFWRCRWLVDLGV
jgi:hypothetical protein